MSINREELMTRHVVFPRSYLKDIEVVLSYPPVEPENIIGKVPAFLEDSFSIKLKDESEESVIFPIQINSKDTKLSFYFDASRSSLSFDASKNYDSFIESILPLTRPLAEFGKNVVGEYGTLSIFKTNVWSRPIDNSSKDVNESLDYLISPKRRAELPNIQTISNTDSWEISMATKSVFRKEIGANITVKLVLTYNNGILTIAITFGISTDKDISYEFFRERLVDMNSFLYGMFIDFVSDSVLETIIQEE